MAAFPNHVARRCAVVADAIQAARAALCEKGREDGKVYYIYVPDGADVAITRALDPLDVPEFSNRDDVRGRVNVILRPVDDTATQPIGPLR